MHAKKTKQRGITADSIRKVTEVGGNLESSKWSGADAWNRRVS